MLVTLIPTRALNHTLMLTLTQTLMQTLMLTAMLKDTLIWTLTPHQNPMLMLTHIQILRPRKIRLRPLPRVSKSTERRRKRRKNVTVKVIRNPKNRKRRKKLRSARRPALKARRTLMSTPKRSKRLTLILSNMSMPTKSLRASRRLRLRQSHAL